MQVRATFNSDTNPQDDEGSASRVDNIEPLRVLVAPLMNSLASKSLIDQVYPHPLPVSPPTVSYLSAARAHAPLGRWILPLHSLSLSLLLTSPAIKPGGKQA